MLLHSPRLRLEPLEERHAEGLFTGLQEPEVHAFTDDQPPTDLAALRERYGVLALRRSPDGTQGWLNWALWCKSESAYVGYVQATVVPGSVNLGYVVFTQYWGRGYAREALMAIMRFITETYPGTEFVARVDARNSRSIALLRRLGFAPDDEQAVSENGVPGDVLFRRPTDRA